MHEAAGGAVQGRTWRWSSCALMGDGVDAGPLREMARLRQKQVLCTAPRCAQQVGRGRVMLELAGREGWPVLLARWWSDGACGGAGQGVARLSWPGPGAPGDAKLVCRAEHGLCSVRRTRLAGRAGPADGWARVVFASSLLKFLLLWLVRAGYPY
ncbi:hypothetical protein Taro_002811 [Colocasia esculenta]|uniref:Uncharacterized protein n=1 Tax=Colocasia esculenta TaxID=4460 RepID=A0A843THK9_COLES|nr:hypothetical protein [Colocasia esculenta]